jgi:hypothetical protein
LRIMIK